MKDSNIILIAGGTGLIGKELSSLLNEHFSVRILTRDKSKCKDNYFYWNPDLGEIGENAFLGVTHIVNLCGAGIADKRWTAKRKKELYDSRIVPAEFLFSKKDLLPDLKHYISASGVNCFDIEQRTKIFTEEDEIAQDFVSQLVKKWEEAADLFQGNCLVSKIRISFVISPKGGGIAKIEQPIKMGFGSVLASGNQGMPWIYIDDLTRIFLHIIEKELAGVYHACAGNTTNKELTLLLAKKNHKRIFLPKVPAFVLNVILGELAILVCEGVRISSQKIINTGFEFKFKNLEDCFESLR